MTTLSVDYGHRRDRRRQESILQRANMRRIDGVLFRGITQAFMMAVACLLAVIAVYARRYPEQGFGAWWRGVADSFGHTVLPLTSVGMLGAALLLALWCARLVNQADPRRSWSRVRDRMGAAAELLHLAGTSFAMLWLLFEVAGLAQWQTHRIVMLGLAVGLVVLGAPCVLLMPEVRMRTPKNPDQKYVEAQALRGWVPKEHELPWLSMGMTALGATLLALSLFWIVQRQLADPIAAPTAHSSESLVIGLVLSVLVVGWFMWLVWYQTAFVGPPQLTGPLTRSVRLFLGGGAAWIVLSATFSVLFRVSIRGTVGDVLPVGGAALGVLLCVLFYARLRLNVNWGGSRLYRKITQRLQKLSGTQEGNRVGLR